MGPTSVRALEVPALLEHKSGVPQHSLETWTLYFILDKPYPHQSVLSCTRPLLLVASLLVYKDHHGFEWNARSPRATSTSPITIQLVLKHDLYTNIHPIHLSTRTSAGQCAVPSRFVLYAPPGILTIYGQMAERSKAPA
jgi:hypothetical protein